MSCTPTSKQNTTCQIPWSGQGPLPFLGSSGSGLRAPGRGVTLPVTVLLLFTMTLAGCDTDRPGEEPVPPPASPVVEPLPAPWTSPELREVVELQLQRDGDGLRSHLSATDPQVRARAALALASVQAPEAFGELTALLEDPEPSVRLEAAFALGQISPPDGGAALVAAMDQEEDPQVRIRLLEAMGKRVARGVGDPLMDFKPRDLAEDAAHRTALARMALGGVVLEGAVAHLVEGLTHDDPEIRKASAYLFGRSVTPEAWAHEREGLREALDRMDRSDPAAIQLVRGIGHLRDWADRDRLLNWLEGGGDWRIRVAAAQALGVRPLLDAEGVGDALARAAEEDRSTHVAEAAATSLTGGADLSPPLLEWARGWLRDGPADRWPAQLPVAEYLAATGEVARVLEWARRVGETHPAVAMQALDLLSLEGDEGVTRYMFDLVDQQDPQIRGLALRTLGSRWRVTAVDETEMERIGVLLMERLAQGAPAEVVGAAQALRVRVYQSVLSEDELLQAVDSRLSQRDGDPVPVTTEALELLTALDLQEGAALVESFLDDPDPSIRNAAHEALERLTGRPAPEEEAADLEPVLDWELLAELGDEPRLRLETRAGVATFRLLPSQAPLTVQTLARLAAEGAYDGVFFHRVIPGFVAQGGDIILGDGTGMPGFTIRSEFTRLPFQRGVLGMASSGKDTEDVQFFVTHARAPHLDGAYTSFGWLESGAEVVDGILAGDRIDGIEVRPGTGS